VLDLTDRMNVIADQWHKGGVTFDAVFSGYLGSARQVEAVQSFVERFCSAETVFVADPAMADRGRLYSGFDMEHVFVFDTVKEALAYVYMSTTGEDTILLENDLPDAFSR
jgi:pyridoxal/pyridoxine/pyridoxamine kinase